MIDKSLDQLWYTWSTSGLGSMSMGYRVRAASEGLQDTQSLRYRRLDRYLRYELPQGLNLSEFDARQAPISLSFVHNGDERLLIRKVFKGRDAAGRYSVYFSHLIAGLPQDFTARDAIRLWNCPLLWRESDEGQHSNDTLLKKIPYSELREYVQNAPTTFDFTWVREQLIHILQTILAQELPSHVYAVGQSALTAALIYGLTHALPLNQFKNLTFSTYESVASESEEVIVGTITSADLGSSELKLNIISRYGTQERLPVSADISGYAKTAVDCLTTANTSKLNRVIAEAEKHNYSTTSELIELYKRRFRQGPLTIKQLVDMVKHPSDNIEELYDPNLQREGAMLIINEQDFWIGEGKGRVFFADTVDKIGGVPASSSDAGLAALSAFIHGMVQQVIDALRETLYQLTGKHQLTKNDWYALGYRGDILITLAPPAKNSAIWLSLLTQFTQEPTYSLVTSPTFREFHCWLLKYAGQMRPLPSIAEITPWLKISSWEKLDELLKLNLPTDWERIAIWGRVEKIPQGAIKVVQAHEAKFKDFLSNLLHLQQPQATEIVVQFFRAMVNYAYTERIGLLVFLLNTSPKDPNVIEQLLACVPMPSEHQLTAQEIDTVLENCRQEVISASSTSPTLITYIKEYVLNVTPDKLKRESALQLLRFLSVDRSLLLNTTSLIGHWLDMASFMQRKTMNRGELEQIGKTLLNIIQVVRQETGIDRRQNFVNTFIPLLVEQVDSETDLAYVIDALGTTLVGSEWDMLRLMAAEAGKNYANHHTLSKLTPYMLCGMREAARSKQARLARDNYLRVLYAEVDSNTLKKIDGVMSSGVWPEFAQNSWHAWRKSASTSTGFNIPIVNRFLPHQQKAQPAPPSHQEGPIYGSSTYSSASPDSWPPIQQAPQQQIVLRAEQVYAPALAVQQEKQSIPQTSNDSKSIAIIKAYKTRISYEFYQKVHMNLQQVLGYWLNMVLLQRHAESPSSKSLAFEIDTMRSLLAELRSQEPGEPSRMVVTYLIDTSFLIKNEITRLTTKQKETPQFFDLEQYIPPRLIEFQSYVGSSHYQQLCNNPFYTQDGIEQALRMLIRRYVFIQYLEGEGKNLQSWLDKERKKANIEYIGV